MLRFKVGTVVPMIGLVLAALSCKKEEPVVPTTTPPDAGAPVVVASAPTTTATAPVGPVTGQCDGAVTLALKTAIDTLAKKDLGAGMKSDGDTVCLMLAEGQTVSASFSFAPGGCYSFIAFGLPNVTEVDIRVKPDLGSPPNPLLAPLASFTGAIDADTGPSAVIGRKNDCIKHPGGLVQIPFAAKAEVTARTGSGPVAVQVFRK